jgi:arylsulfatase A-like enzyme
VAIWGVHVGVTARPGRATAGATGAARTDSRPNIVMVLMDDASYELLSTMPQALRMQADGATYENAHVVDSLCCPSRASIFTGQAPHQTGVLTNTARDPKNPIGGYLAYAAHNDGAKAFNLALQRSGYTTGFIGKYLNGYEMRTSNHVHHPPPKVAGWDTFDAILGGGYHEWGFWSTRQDQAGNLSLVHDPKPPRSSPPDVLDQHYATNVAAADAVRFLDDHRTSAKPYFLEVATYAPHAQLKKAYPDDPPFPSAFADRAPKGDPTGGFCGTRPCGDLTLRDLKGYGDPRADNRPTYLHGNGTTSAAPAWNTNRWTLSAKKALASYRDRARMVQSVDRLVGQVRAAVGPNTYVVLTSDNGYHLGQLQLNGGKGTPYDFDTHVPLVVVGPGVTPGRRQQFVSNMDLAPTFESLAGLRPPDYMSGSSFAASLHKPRSPGGRYVFYDHTYAQSQKGEVDNDTATGGDLEQIPSYIGVRGRQGLLVRLDLDNSWTGHRYAWELYRYNLPWEARNVFAQDHKKPWARALMRHLRMWDDCAPARCRAAAG